MTFTITKPGFYRTRDGRKEEVLAVLPERAGATFPVIGAKGEAWTENGLWIPNEESGKDLVAEYVPKKYDVELLRAIASGQPYSVAEQCLARAILAITGGDEWNNY